MTRVVRAFGQPRSITEWSRETGLSYQTIWTRLRSGWTAEDAVGRMSCRDPRRYATRDKTNAVRAEVET